MSSLVRFWTREGRIQPDSGQDSSLLIQTENIDYFKNITGTDWALQLTLKQK